VRRQVARALLALTLVGLAGAARAAEGEVAVLSFDLHGLARATLPGFEASLEVGLANAGWMVKRNHADTQAMLAVAPAVPRGCRVGPCLATIGQALGVTHVVDTSVTARGAQFDIILTMLDARTGNVVGQTVRTCPVCTVDEALVMLAAAAEDIGNKGMPETPYRPRVIHIVAGPPPRSRWRARTGYVGMLLGVVAVAAALALDERGEHLATVTPLFSVGGVLFGAGALLVGSDDPGPGGMAGRRGAFGSVMSIQTGYLW
jgi:hypothetical protein